MLAVEVRGEGYVPGKAFDRFITIWLENQVRIWISIGQWSHEHGLHHELHYPRRSRSIKLTTTRPQDFSSVSQNPDIRSLAKSGILLTSFYGLTHPSQPNYIASVGADYFGLDHDDVVRLPENVSTVVDLFDTKGISWKEYMEDVPGPGFMGSASVNEAGKPSYVRKHKYGCC